MLVLMYSDFNITVGLQCHVILIISVNFTSHWSLHHSGSRLSDHSWLLHMIIMYNNQWKVAFILAAVHKCQHFRECTNHTLSETLSLHFLSAKNPHESNKNQAKKLKVFEKNVDYHRHPPEIVWFVHS